MRTMCQIHVVQWVLLSSVLLTQGCHDAGAGGPYTKVDSGIRSERDASPGEEGGMPSTLDAGSDASSRDAGEADAAAELPSITSIDPMRVARGEQVVIHGMHLDAVGAVNVAGAKADVLSISATELAVEVPAEIPGNDCETVADLDLVAQSGSASGKLILLQPGPSVTELNGSDVRAGENIVMRGSRLADARVTLNDVELMVVERSAESLTVAIPLDGPRGAATLTVTGACDHMSLMVGVLPPLPRIIAIDQTTLAPNGVTRITFDMENLSELLGVRVGDDWVPMYEAVRYLWFPADEGSRLRTVAVRMPADLPLGKLNLTLVGQFSESLPAFVQGVPPAPMHPDPPVRILWPATAAYDDTTYPIGSVAHAFHPSLVNQYDPKVNWSYELSFADSGSSGDDSGGEGSCANEGIVSGLERHCVACTDALGCNTTAGDICHPISGHYRLDTKDDLVEIDIDRTSTGGSVEHYVGGWASYEGYPPGISGNAWDDINLVLRSVHSGLQLAIDHLIANRACNESMPYRPGQPRPRKKRGRLRRRRVRERKLVLSLSLLTVVGSVQGCSTDKHAAHEAQTQDASTDMNPVQGAHDAGSAVPDAQSDDGGQVVDNGRELPILASIEPPRVARGEQIVIAGSHLRGVDHVRIGGIASAVLGGSSDRLVVQVPTKISGEACETSVEVVLETEAAASDPFPLTLVRRAPTVTGFDGTDVRSGTSFVIAGTNLEDAQVSLGDTKLSVEERSASALKVAVPNGTSRGEAQLRVTGTCGQTSLAVSVLPPLPRILSIDQLTLSPNGVTRITFEMDQPAELRGIRVGSGWVPANDPKYCGWLPSSDGSSVRTIAVRMPDDMPLGDNSLSLAGLFGESSSFTIQGVEPPALVPFPPLRILWPSSQAIDDGTFPVGTRTPFSLGDLDPAAPPDPTEGWSYYLSFEGVNGSDCGGGGTVTGMERHCVGGCSSATFRCDPNAGDACNPLSGTFRLTRDTNMVEIDIDRSASGGLPQPEHFVGGWVGPDGISQPGSVVGQSEQRLVLRSTYSGLQLDIVHFVEHCGY
jgi:hypothetical protein